MGTMWENCGENGKCGENVGEMEKMWGKGGENGSGDVEKLWGKCGKNGIFLPKCWMGGGGKVPLEYSGTIWDCRGPFLTPGSLPCVQVGLP